MELTQAEKEILAYTLLGEAGGEGRAGMAAVMNVIKNRAESGRYSDNPAAVALQKNGRGIRQFSTWNTKENGGNQPISRYKKSSKEFKEALAIVEKVMAGQIPDETGGATHFVTKALFDADKPGWWDSEAPQGEKQIGNHVFGVRTPQTAAAAAALGAGRATTKAAQVPLETPEMLSFAPIGTPASSAARGAGAATGAAREGESGGELVARTITTVRIDPLTGQPLKPATTANNRVGRAATVASANANLAQAQVEQAAQRGKVTRSTAVTDGVRNLGNVPAGGVSGTYRDEAAGAIPARQVIVKPDGTVQEVQVARTVAMPRDARPSLPGDVPDAVVRGMYMTSKPVLKTVSYQTTVRVKNPNYVPNASGSPDDRDATNALRSKLAAGAAATGAAALEPEFIEKVVTLQKQITVPGTPIVPAVPRVPIVAPRTPNARVIEQDQELRRERGKQIAAANRKSPNPTYDVSGGNNAFNPRSVQESVRWQTGY